MDDILTARVRDALAGLVAEGALEEVAGEASGERSDVRFMCVPPPPSPVQERTRRRPRGIRARRLEAAVRDFGVLKPELEDVDLQSRLEEQFSDFFLGVVSEWNPCYDDSGLCRYRWDEELGAHDMDVEISADVDAGGLADEGLRRTSEDIARELVRGAAPERVNLRQVLDAVLSGGSLSNGFVDVQPLRRLVAALVNRVARHTRHGMGPPKIGVHACARGKESCPHCRYGFPRERLPRGSARGMVMSKGDREGQWHACFPRNDRLCCSYEAHILLANMGNIDWRPVLNLWAVSEYVTKYAAKAPKGSRRVHDVLRDAVDEVCTYVPDGEGADMLRRSIQKFFARVLGERDYHLYEAVPLGLQLPSVIPLMPTVSLNTSGTRPLKSYKDLKDKGDDVPVHWDSKVDKFNQRLWFVRRQRDRGDLIISEAEVRDVSMFEFYWKFYFVRGRIRRSTSSACIMVTPSYSADCADVQHPSHEGYARALVIAHWRHMPTDRRRELIQAQTEFRAVSDVCIGGTAFTEPPIRAGPDAESTERYLGVRDLLALSERAFGADRDTVWGRLFMEMVTDPMLRQWVPHWVIEQYERANPFYKEVLTQLQADTSMRSNRRLLRCVRREMILRHERQKRRQAAARARGVGSGDEAGTSDDAGGGAAGSSGEDAADRERAEALAESLVQGGDDEDPNEQKMLLIREPRPGDVVGSGGGDGEEGDWARRTAEERLSAAGAAVPADDLVVGEVGTGARSGGAMFNPVGYDWVNDPVNVAWSRKHDIEKLVEQWYGKGLVADGADPVLPDALDDWQRFAHDIVAGEERRPGGAPVRLMLLGSAGTGKSRTVRSFVGTRRARVRSQVDLGYAKYKRLSAAGKKEVVKNSCLLAAPTGCASFQLKFGAQTLHRAFGVPVHYCGPASGSGRSQPRFLARRDRLRQAELLLLDELSMLGRGMLGKIEFKVRDFLRGVSADVPAGGLDEQLLAGKDAVLAGDWKQAPPIGDDPLYRFGSYSGKGQNKPKGADQTPTNAWTTHRLHQVGSAVRDSFEDVAFLRQVHRYSDFREGLSSERQKEYSADAARFQKVTRGMAECTWSMDDHAWLSRRNRSIVQRTPEGRAELARFEDAPLLMDGRVDRITGEVGANTVNRLKLNQCSAASQKPIAVLSAFHDKKSPVTGADDGRPKKMSENERMAVERMSAEDFRGVENEVCVCEGARVLLTQNLWVDAGLVNGALGNVVGYMWPEGADPHHAERKDLRMPHIVFVKFDSVNLVGEDGRRLTFFPDDPGRVDWVPIFAQKAMSTAEEELTRANFPLTLAWALTHWKAQGMTLDRVRVHLSARTAGAAGIGFVACTRVRHPWDLIFEEDLPEYVDFMKVRRTRAFRERKRYELRCEARASRTLRRYGFCRGDVWTEAERDVAAALLQGLKAVGKERLDGMPGSRRKDDDTWVWGDGEPDYDGELAAEVTRQTLAEPGRRLEFERVAMRLLDRVRVRQLQPTEMVDVELLCEGFGGSGELARASSSDFADRMKLAASRAAGGDAVRERRLLRLVDLVIRRVDWIGNFDGKVVDDVVSDIQPLHMSAVKEALRALIPERLHGSLDRAVASQKDVVGSTTAGASFLTMDDWRVSVQKEDFLHRGRLTEDVLEFMVLVLRRLCRVLDLPIAVASKTVGRQVGMQESPEKLAGVMRKWKRVWDPTEVLSASELLLPVAVDERAQDWLCVSVRSSADGGRLRDSKRLRVLVYDASRREALAGRVAKNVDALVRGVAARLSAEGPIVEFAEAVPKCDVKSQQIAAAFGVLLGRVAAAAKEDALNVASGSFVPDTCAVLRAAFARFRSDLEERGGRDVGVLLSDAAQCRAVLRAFGKPPSLTERRAGVGGAFGASGSCPVGPASDLAAGRRAEGEACEGGQGGGLLRVATWNIAGGQKSAQAPDSFDMKDQRAALVGEVSRWCHAFRCDAVALQECEGPGRMEEFDGSLVFVGSAAATQTRGYVHMYVRPGVQYERVVVDDGSPCVAARVQVSSSTNEQVCVVAVHLPAGAERAGERQRALSLIVQGVRREEENVLVVGDFNIRDDEVDGISHETDLKNAFYSGATWGVSWNKFHREPRASTGVGFRFDRAFFGRKLWAEAHLIGQGRQSFDGREFCLSDHFGLMVYADVSNVFASRVQVDRRAAQLRRARLAAMRERAQQAEAAEVRARRQAAREGQAVARRRAEDRDREGFCRAQQRGARARERRRAEYRRAAFGSESLFADGLQGVVLAQGPEAPTAASNVMVPGMGGLTGGCWEDLRGVPLVGLQNMRNTCFVSSIVQVILRVPAVLDWVRDHVARGCPRAGFGLECVVCSLGRTLQQIVGARGSCDRPDLVLRRAEVQADFGDGGQHDAGEFLDYFLAKACDVEVGAGRCASWCPGQMQGQGVATHVHRICWMVRETRRRCRACGLCKASFEACPMWDLEVLAARGGADTISEMYLRSCGPSSTEPQHCERCAGNHEHTEQNRVTQCPNVLIFRVKRVMVGGQAGQLARREVAVDEDIQLPGFPRMLLAGVVYHSGATARGGHYTAVCRDSNGRFWSYDDRIVRAVSVEVARFKPTQVHTVVYVRADGRSSWIRDEGADRGDMGDGAAVVHVPGSPEGGGAAGALEGGGGMPTIRKRKAAASEGGVCRSVPGEAEGGCSGGGGEARSERKRLRGKSSVGSVGETGAAARARVGTSSGWTGRSDRGHGGAGAAECASPVLGGAVVSGTAPAAVPSKRSAAPAPVRRSARLASRLPELAAESGNAGGSSSTGGGVAIVAGVLSRAPQVGSVGDANERAAPRVVSGFGSERIPDLAAHVRERDSREMRTAAERSAEGTRGAAVDWRGDALDRSHGGAWHAGR